jgi:hypothetical protein
MIVSPFGRVGHCDISEPYMYLYHLMKQALNCIVSASPVQKVMSTMSERVYHVVGLFASIRSSQYCLLLINLIEPVSRILPYSGKSSICRKLSRDREYHRSQDYHELGLHSQSCTLDSITFFGDWISSTPGIYLQ